MNLGTSSDVVRPDSLFVRKILAIKDKSDHSCLDTLVLSDLLFGLLNRRSWLEVERSLISVKCLKKKSSEQRRLARQKSELRLTLLSYLL